MPSVSLKLPGTNEKIVVEADDYETALNEIGSNPLFEASMAKLVEGAGFTRFYADGQNDNAEWAQELTERFLLEGPEAAENYLRDTIGRSPDEHYRHFIEGGRAARELTAEVRAAVERAFDEEEAFDIENAVDDFMRDHAASLLEQDDDSKPFDAIEPFSKVVVGFFPGQQGDFPNVEDEAIMSADKSLRLESVEPSRLLAAYLSFVNVPRDELLAAWKDARGVDVLDPERGTHQSDHAWEQQLERAKRWAEFDWETDPDRPRLQTKEQICEVFDNGDYCSVPVLVFRVPLKQFLTRDWEAPLELSPGPGGRVGDVGFHNFLHGSGHARGNKEPIVLPAGRGGFRPTENTGYGYAKVYGLSLSHLDVAIADGPKVEAAPDEPAAAPRP